MRRQTLTDFAASVLDAPMSRLRNRVIAIAVCLAAVIGAIYCLLAAAILALEPQVGVVYARLIVAAAFVIIAVVALMIPRLIAPRTESIAERAHEEAKAMPKNDRLAMIIEAVLMGFSASAGRKPASKP